MKRTPRRAAVVAKIAEVAQAQAKAAEIKRAEHAKVIAPHEIDAMRFTHAYLSTRSAVVYMAEVIMLRGMKGQRKKSIEAQVMAHAALGDAQRYLDGKNDAMLESAAREEHVADIKARLAEVGVSTAEYAVAE